MSGRCTPRNDQRYVPLEDYANRPLCKLCPIWFRKRADFFDSYRKEELCARHVMGRSAFGNVVKRNPNDYPHFNHHANARPRS